VPSAKERGRVMSKEIEKFGMENRLQVTEDQKALVKRTIFAGATDDELALFIFECERRGVHPLDRLIHPVKRGKDENSRVSFQTSIDYLRSESETAGDYAGIDEPEFGKCDTAGYPEYAKVTIYRSIQGEKISFTGVTRWKEFYPGETLGFMWRKMPHHMLAKCAEAQARRLAWPKRLAGLYIQEELNQPEKGEKKKLTATVQPPPQANGNGEDKPSDELANPNQLKAINTILNHMKIDGDLERHETVAVIVGLKEVPASLSTLTKPQASKAIEGLQIQYDRWMKEKK